MPGLAPLAAATELADAVAIGVRKAQRGEFDEAELLQCGEAVGVSDLLRRARAATASDGPRTV